MEFGDIVKIKEKYKRVWGTRPSMAWDGETSMAWDGEMRETSTKEWIRTKFHADGCIFLGYRTLSNGWNEYEHEAGYIFSPTERFKAALVCPDMRKNPVYVPLDAIS